MKATPVAEMSALGDLKSEGGASHVRNNLLKSSLKANQALDGLDAAKRRTLTKLALGAAFVTPVVASFSMDGLTISKVHAETAKRLWLRQRQG